MPRPNSKVALAVLAFALAASPAAAQVQSAPLAQVDAWGVGWIGANEGAVPATFWANADAETLAPVLAAIDPRELSPAGAASLRRILSSRAKGPAGADLTAERLRLLDQLGDTAHAIDLRKRYPATDWGKSGERLGAEFALLQGEKDAACAAAKPRPATDPDWMPLRAVCAALDGDANAVSLATEQIARADETLGVWLIGALPAIGAPDIKKPDGRYGTPLEAAVSVAAKLPATNAALATAPAEIAAAVALDKNATLDQRRAALRPAFDAGKLKAADALVILALKDETPPPKAASRTAPKPDYIALAIAASTAKDAKPDTRAAAYAEALRSAASLEDGRFIAALIAAPIKALPRSEATLPYAEAFARAALLSGDAKQAADWRKFMGTVAKDKLDAWAAARLDLLLAWSGASTEKPSAILDRMIAAAPYPVAPAPGATPPAKPPAVDQQLAIRRIETTRALFLTTGLGHDLTAAQRSTLAAQRTAGRGVSDSAIARITAAARQNVHAEAALATLGQLGPDPSALSFAGLADLLGQLRTIGFTDDAAAIALESLQVWKAF